MIPDGAGGVIVAWSDERSGANEDDIYAQRISATGLVLWANDGVVVCNASGEQQDQVIVSDGTGGAIIAWTDPRSAGFFAQRLDANGAPQWAANGVPLAVSPAIGRYPRIVSDGQGGVVAAWLDYRNPGVANVDIYAQRLNAAGVRLWNPAGVAVCTQEGTQIFHVTVSDGSGGIIVGWHDERIPNAYPYAQRIDAAGAPRWTQNGVRLTSALTSLWDVFMTSDGAGGATACWTANGVHAQRIDNNGALKWDAGAVTVWQGPASDPAITTDGVGGAVIAWVDFRNTGNTYPDDTYPQDLYAQRVSAAGQLLWDANAVEIVKAPWEQRGIRILPLANGASMIAWSDDRDGFLVTHPYAQVLGADGVRRWEKNGRRLTTSAYRQLPSDMGRDQLGGVIITLGDAHNGTTQWDVYSTRVSDSVPASVPSLPVLPMFSNHPNPFSSTTNLELNLKASADVTVEIFDAAGRRVRAFSTGQLPAGPQEVPFDGLGGNGKALPSGIYFCRVNMAGTSAVRKLVITR